MNRNSDLEKTLREVVDNVVKRIASTSEPEIRQSLFHEYREWLGENINNSVLAIPKDWKR